MAKLSTRFNKPQITCKASVTYGGKNEIALVIIMHDTVTSSTREFHIATFTCIPFAELAGRPPRRYIRGKNI